MRFAVIAIPQRLARGGVAALAAGGLKFADICAVWRAGWPIGNFVLSWPAPLEDFQFVSAGQND
ncbi:MAG: hypothetical protein JO139_08205 [Alphaproteobacteria bacterium]|nr:hypothetical protein [Alphaproteobacteria bacterium]